MPSHRRAHHHSSQHPNQYPGFWSSYTAPAPIYYDYVPPVAAAYYVPPVAAAYYAPPVAAAYYAPAAAAYVPVPPTLDPLMRSLYEYFTNPYFKSILQGLVEPTAYSTPYADLNDVLKALWHALYAFCCFSIAGAAALIMAEVAPIIFAVNLVGAMICALKGDANKADQMFSSALQWLLYPIVALPIAMICQFCAFISSTAAIVQCATRVVASIVTAYPPQAAYAAPISSAPL